MTEKLIKPFVTSLVGAIALYIVLMLATGYRETASAISMLSGDAWLVLTGLIVVHLVLRFLRWQVYLIKLGHPIPWLPSLVNYLAGFALTTTPGKVGETMRSAYLTDYGVDYPSSLAAFFAERFTDLLAVATLAFLAVTQFRGEIWPTLLVCALILCALLLVRAPFLPRYVEQLAGNLNSERLAHLLLQVAHALRASASLLELPTLLASYLLALLAWATQAAMLYVIAVYMGLSIDPALAIGIFSLGLLVGALSFIPGGLGSTEAVILLMLVNAGIATADASGATLLVRVATLWFVVAIGCVALLIVEITRRRRRLLPTDSHP